MGRKMRFKGVKHTPKRLEEELLAKSGELWENPEILRPQCIGGCRKCHFDKTFSRISSLERIMDDEDALIKAASRGRDDIVKAYAATVSLYVAGSIPYLATAKIAGEEISFARRGRVRNDKLIGCQYYDDPEMRLLLYNTIASKKKLRMYSYGDNLVCSDVPNMPREYLTDVFGETPYKFPDDGLSCGHGGKGVLIIKIKSLREEIRICQDCAKDTATLPVLISRHLSRDPLEDIEVSVEHRFHSANEGDLETVSGDLLKKYAGGAVTDAGVLEHVLKEKAESLREGDVATYVIGSKNYGSDLDSFLSDLNGTNLEIEAIDRFLRGSDKSVIVRSERASEVLGLFWADDYRAILETVSDAETAEGLGDVSRKNPGDALRDAHSAYISKDVVASLPDFGKRVGEFTRLSDAYAKAYKVGGLELLEDEVKANSKRDWKFRALARSFLIAAGGSPDGHGLKKDEIGFSDFLVPFVEQLVESSGEKYREDMNTLLTAIGCGERV